MLERLDEIDWSALTHAYGPATDVPQTMRRLVSDDEAERKEALLHLFGTIWRLGMVYDATIPAIAFLYDLLATDGPQDKQGIAMLLAFIATGRGYFHVWASGAYGRQTIWEEILRKDGAKTEEELQREAVRIQGVRNAISRSLPLLIPYLADPEQEVRLCVSRAVATYVDFRDEILPALRAAEAFETDEHVRKAMRNAIESLRRSPS